MFHISDRVDKVNVWDRPRADGRTPLDLTHFSEAYYAPEVTFTDLGNTIVAGNSFCVKSEALGIIRDSLSLVESSIWAHVIPPGEKLVQIDNEEPMLIVGNLAPQNYYHWTLQSFANFLVYRQLTGSDDFAIVMPSLNSFQARTIAVADFFGRRFEIEYNEVAMVSHGVYGNLCGGTYSFSPHPVVLAAFDAFAADVTAERSFGRRIYVSRLDASHMRSVVNEDELCRLMVRHGFEIITPGQLPIEEQIVALRDAEVVVGPHGAGLSNLVYCRSNSGTRVVELAQAGYMPGSYIRICQGKGLDYTAVISSDVVPTDQDGVPVHQRNFNNVSNEIDLGLLDSVLSKL